MSFQRQRVRSSRRSYPPFNLPMGRSLRFRVYSLRLDAQFRLGFPSAPLRYSLTLPQRVTRRLIMQKARGHPVGLPQLVGTRFQVLFTPLVGVLFIVQSPYWFTIGRRGVFSLTRWASHIRAEFHELHATQGHVSNPRYRTVTYFGPPFQTVHAVTLTPPRSLAATCGIAFASFSSGY